jgi:hypothetical protein
MFVAQNSLFMHIPRTGGSFVKKTLRAHGNVDIHSSLGVNVKPHFSLSRIPDICKHKKTIWTCVRNPVNHLHSFWACRWTIFLPKGHRELRDIYRPLFEKSFAAFVEGYLEHSPGSLSLRYREWLTEGDSYPAIDHFLKTENLEADLLRVGKELNFKLPESFGPKYNSSPRKDDNLPESLKQQLMDAEADMMNTFNY